MLIKFQKFPKSNKYCVGEQKVCKGTKINVLENKKVPLSQNEAHKVPIATDAKCYLHIMELNCRVCLVMAVYGLIVYHGHVSS